MSDFGSAFASSPYYSTAIDAANTFGVPVNLFVDQIGQESSFNPSAQNGNASGIAQFMPSTAAQFGINPSDPTSSLYAAAQYDAQLYNSTGSWTSALQSYGTLPKTQSTPLTAGQSASAIAAQIADNSPFGQVISGISNGISDVGSIGKTLTLIDRILTFLTEPARLATFLIGLLLLGAGLFMLGQKQIVGAVNTVIIMKEKSKKKKAKKEKEAKNKKPEVEE